MNIRRSSFPVGLATALLTASLQSPLPTLAAPADDSITLPATELLKMGVNPRMIVMAHLSPDTSLAIGSEMETRTSEIAAHHLYKLHLFKLDWAAHKVKHEQLSLPLKASIQTCLTPDARSLVCAGDDGSELGVVDLEHNNGKPGFHVAPLRIWSDHDGVYTRGFFYDETQLSQGRCVVKVSATGSGLAAVTKVRDIEPLLAKVPFYASCIWQNADEAWFSVLRPDKAFDVVGYQGDDSHLLHLGHVARVDSFASGQGKLLYGIREADRSGRLYVYDSATRKRQPVGDGRSSYTYLYMSRDGGTILTSVLDPKGGRMTTWYGHESESYDLRPMPAMSNIEAGTIRMASSGQAITFLGRDGLTFRKVPAK